jgi:tripartite motif-containing protein 71
MAAMIANALRLTVEPDAATGFTDDLSIPSWAKGAVAALKNLGIIDGSGLNRFQADAEASRAEAITALLRMLENMSK